MAGVGPVKTIENIPDAKNSNHPLGTTKNENKFTKFCRVSLCKVVIARYGLLYKAHVPVHSKKKFSMASRINSGASILADKIDRMSKNY